MARWSLEPRTLSPRSASTGRRGQSETRRLTPTELQCERLVLATDMLALVLEDGQGLPGPMQEELQGLYAALGVVLQQTRRLP